MPTNDHSHWMRRCLQLAALGGGNVAPNPLVGAVLVKAGSVLAEGWHRAFGGPHAEVECLRAFGDAPIPQDAVMYVNLEPCAHYGKTPPCAELLVERGVRHVVIGQRDPFPSVAGRGIRILEDAGISVTERVLSNECRWTQRRFLTSVVSGRPYIILKWAMSADGFLDRHPRTGRGVQRISHPATNVLVHRWRSMEQAILVGSRTVLNDNPSLTVRHCEGRHPLRVVLDRGGLSPAKSAVFSDEAPTLLFTAKERTDVPVEQVLLQPTDDPLVQLIDSLNGRNIRSVMVEGGAEMLGHFIRRGLWDEARVITGDVHFSQGAEAPKMYGAPSYTVRSATDRIDYHLNADPPIAGTATYPASWSW